MIKLALLYILIQKTSSSNIRANRNNYESLKSYKFRIIGLEIVHLHRATVLKI